MRLARAWRRQILGASLAAVLIPAAIIVPLAVLASAGEFRRIGGLGQVFAGPGIPAGGVVGHSHGPRPVPAPSLDRLASSPAVAGGAARAVRLSVTPSGSGAGGTAGGVPAAGGPGGGGDGGRGAGG